MSTHSETGTYRYRRDGVLLGVSDTFTIDGASIHSMREQTGGVRMEVDAMVDTTGLVGRFDLLWTHSAEGQIARRLVTYSLADGELTVTVDGSTRRQAVAPDAVLFPLLRVFQGAVILAVADAGPAGRTVIIPDLHHLADPERLLLPTVETRTARCLSSDASTDASTAVSSDASTAVPTVASTVVSTFSYEGSVYDGSARFFIDVARRQMTGYQFPQPDGSVIEVRLER